MPTPGVGPFAPLGPSHGACAVAPAGWPGFLFSPCPFSSSLWPINSPSSPWTFPPRFSSSWPTWPPRPKPWWAPTSSPSPPSSARSASRWATNRWPSSPKPSTSPPPRPPTPPTLWTCPAWVPTWPRWPDWSPWPPASPTSATASKAPTWWPAARPRRRACSSTTGCRRRPTNRWLAAGRLYTSSNTSAHSTARPGRVATGMGPGAAYSAARRYSSFSST